MSRFPERQPPLVPFVVPISLAHLLAFQVLHLVLIPASCTPYFLRGVVVWTIYHLQRAIHLRRVWWNCIASWAQAWGIDFHRVRALVCQLTSSHWCSISELIARTFLSHWNVTHLLRRLQPRLESDQGSYGEEPE